MTTHAERRATTQRALVDATSALLDEGGQPTIEEVATRAGVSRATAYRHFPGIDDLLWQAFVNRTITSVADTFAGCGDDVACRVERCEEVINGFLLNDPVGTRAFERSTLQRWLERGPEAAERPSRRLTYIDEALSPLGELDRDLLARLRNSLAVIMGTEATIALTDVCGLASDEAQRVSRWMAQTLVRETLDPREAVPSDRPPSRPARLEPLAAAKK
jgi:AcrR family transcriptional regulator